MNTENCELRNAVIGEIECHLLKTDTQEFNKPIVAEIDGMKGAILKVHKFANGEIRCLFETLFNNGFIRIYQPLDYIDTRTLITVACHP